jgi:hypothetical protein
LVVKHITTIAQQQEEDAKVWQLRLHDGGSILLFDAT